MAWQFSSDGKYFAELTSEGQLKIWNTVSNIFEQEFTPDFHLHSPCICLQFVDSIESKKRGLPFKKRKKDPHLYFIVLGTASGSLLVYSLAKGDLEFTINRLEKESINCLSSTNSNFIYSGSNSNILVWDLYTKKISSQWSSGTDAISAILATPDEDKLISASKTIKLWNIKNKRLLKYFAGHSSPVTTLNYVICKDVDFFISSSKGDRLLSCWSLNDDSEKTAFINFSTQDIVSNVSINVQQNNLHIAATVRNGVVNYFQHHLHGKKSTKPVKAKSTIQIVADSQPGDAVLPIEITASTFRDSEALCICYGLSIAPIFEEIQIVTTKRVQCLVRKDPKNTLFLQNGQSTKVRTPIVDHDVHYLSTQTSSANTKRKNNGQQEVPMEKRLENLIVSDADSNKTPTVNNMAQLLIQGLHSKDKTILRTVLMKKDEQLIKNTIKRIPILLLEPLFEELTKLLQGKTLLRQIGLIWLKNLILIYSGLLLSNPDLQSYLTQILATIEASLALQAPRNKLLGRLELLVSQINGTTQQEGEDDDSVLVFNDRVSVESDIEEMEFADDSLTENEWEENSEQGDDEKNNDSCSDSEAGSEAHDSS